jgi:hypothetical protein
MWYTYTSIVRGITPVSAFNNGNTAEYRCLAVCLIMGGISVTAFIQNLAHKITALGLTGPAILLLEANKPLAFVSSQLLLVAQPTLNIFFASHLTHQAIDLLADPAQVEQLIAALETCPAQEVTP